jgi:hypothetical protein
LLSADLEALPSDVHGDACVQPHELPWGGGLGPGSRSEDGGFNHHEVIAGGSRYLLVFIISSLLHAIFGVFYVVHFNLFIYLLAL